MNRFVVIGIVSIIFVFYTNVVVTAQTNSGGVNVFEALKGQLQNGAAQVPIGGGLYLPSGMDEDLLMNLSPEIPKPLEQFNISLEKI